jgi:UPF0176 protein
MTVHVCALYRFFAVDDCPALRGRIRDILSRHGILGTILVAPEGINGTVAGTRIALDSMLADLDSLTGILQGEVKFSTAQTMPFRRLKVRLKKEIVTLKQPGIDPTKIVGTYVAPQDWNALIADPDVVVLDTRNDYEVEMGTFKRALDPKTQHFSQFPDFVQKHLDPAKHKKIAMFCTGGIRCEKASSYMLSQGFEEVYHLKGGILKYLEEIPQDQSLWNGSCFVFDHRIGLGHGLVENAPEHHRWDRTTRHESE